MPTAIMECGDFSEFQDALKNMRKVDDIIINTLNTVVPTDSFHADSGKACKELLGQIEEGNVKREKSIKNCIVLSAERVKKLREQRAADSNDVQVSKDLRAEQTKLRMLQVELSVEELVRQRTSKVFNERCRRYMSNDKIMRFPMTRQIECTPKLHIGLNPLIVTMRKELMTLQQISLEVRKQKLREQFIQDFMQEDRELRQVGLAYINDIQ